MTDEITLPPLTDEQCKDLAREVDLDWHRGFQVCEPENRYAALCRAAVLLDRQQQAAPSAEPVAHIFPSDVKALQLHETWAMVYSVPVGSPDERSVPLYTAQPDHRAAMQQALDALEERYVGALRDSAIDALRAALGEK